jgi:hypothetical protein
MRTCRQSIGCILRNQTSCTEQPSLQFLKRVPFRSFDKSLDNPHNSFIRERLGEFARQSMITSTICSSQSIGTCDVQWANVSLRATITEVQLGRSTIHTKTLIQFELFSVWMQLWPREMAVRKLNSPFMPDN